MQTLRRILLVAIVMWVGPAFATAAASAPAAEKVPAIPGQEIVRPAGGYLGLQLLNNNFVLSFYDADKKPVAPDVVRATLRWSVNYQPSDERVVLNLGGGGVSLTSAKVIRPPHNFRLYLALFVEGNDDAVETHMVSFAAK